MKSNRGFARVSLLAFLIVFAWMATGAYGLGQEFTDDELPFYLAGINEPVKMGLDLRQTLSEKRRSVLDIQPVAVEISDRPYVMTKELKDPSIQLTLSKVFISAGFVDLMNHVAHAKAIDQIQRGYFRDYLSLLAAETGGDRLQDLPGVLKMQFWSDDIMNEQLSNFHQMAGIVLGIEMSHQYLGHFRKYQSEMTQPAGKRIPINRLLTGEEWDRAMRAGAINALFCGYGIDGVIALYESIDKMPARPDWTEYFLPKKANVRKLRRDLRKLERDFFSGQLKQES